MSRYSSLFIYVFSLFAIITNVVGQSLNGSGIGYFTECTINTEPTSKTLVSIDLDSLSGTADSTYQSIDKDKLPVYYYRALNKEICFDGTCRKLNVSIYWNVTGRYLGFRLPEREYLSKSEHKPFEKVEYARLHELLMDSLSILASTDLDKIISNKSILSEVDGVTRPTSEDILEYIVQGAVFTTFAMWKGIYGNTQQIVEIETEKKLNTKLMFRILQSPVPWDRVWGIQRLALVKDAPMELKQEVINIISNDQHNVSSNAISLLPKEWLTDHQLQQSLWSIFDSVEYTLRASLIQKLSTAQDLDKSILIEIADNLKLMNGPILNVSLECLKKYIHVYPEIYQSVKELSRSDNPYIVRQVEKMFSDG